MSALPNASAVWQIAPLEIQSFVLHEARLLDERRFEEWLALLTDDIIYWVPTRPDQASGEEEASSFYDDREMLEARIARLRHPKIWSQLPHARTTRLVSNITVDDGFTGEGIVRSSFLTLEYRPGIEQRGMEQRVLGGTNEHLLRRTPDGLKIVKKKVVLVNCDATLSNLAIPF